MNCYLLGVVTREYPNFGMFSYPKPSTRHGFAIQLSLYTTWFCKKTLPGLVGANLPKPMGSHNEHYQNSMVLFRLNQQLSDSRLFLGLWRWNNESLIPPNCPWCSICASFSSADFDGSNSWCRHHMSSKEKQHQNCSTIFFHANFPCPTPWWFASGGF